jgi:hypothetical protein
MVFKKVLLWSGLFVVGTLIGFELAWLLSRFQRSGENGAPIASKRGSVEITLSATVDGSERFIFTRDTAWDDHGRWQSPRDVLLNGQLWEDLSQSPPGWTELAATLDLSKAAITVRNGRDIIALEPTPEGFDLYMADTQMGSANYSVTISIPRR